MLLWKTFNPLSANPIKWSNTLKQFIGNLPTNCLSVFDHFINPFTKLSQIREWAFEQTCNFQQQVCYLLPIWGHQMLKVYKDTSGFSRNEKNFTQHSHLIFCSLQFQKNTA